MKRLPIIFFLLLAFTLSSHADGRPNIVVVLCDDLGWGDIQNHGHPHIKTPRLMQMAAEGIQFSSFYSAAPVCSPSRVGLLTGRSPNRAGVYDWIPGASADKPVANSRQLVHLRKEEFTIAQMLKDAGYATCLSGKWHCNAMFNSNKQAQPHDNGFDHWFATQNNASPSHENPVNFVRNGTPVGKKLEGFSCTIVAEEAMNWLTSHQARSPEQPFFLYVAYHEPHEPVASPPEMVKRYEDGPASNHDEAQYFANVENLDAATGLLIDHIDKLGYKEDTLIIFTSDNGPETLNRYKNAKRSYGVSGPLRGMKLHTHEAGFRVAGIMRWPAQIKPGQKSDTPVSSLDFFPTFAGLADAEIPDDLTLDGTNFLPAINGDPLPREKPLLWAYYNSYNGSEHVPTVAMRDGNMKVRATLHGMKQTSQLDKANLEAIQSATPGDFEIYDLSKDPAEENPLPTEGNPLPEKMKRLYGELLSDSHIWPAVKKAKNQ